MYMTRLVKWTSPPIFRSGIIKVWIIFAFLDMSNQAFSQQRPEVPEDEQAIKATSYAQGKRAHTFTYKALQIGDRVPDIIMDTIFNYPNSKARFSDFKGKHILLDFWSRGCSSCIGAFPKMQKLQQKFSNRIQILAVCTYNRLEALNLREPGFPKNSTSEGIRSTTLPLVFNNQDMVDFFPHRFEPYLVWIDSNRIVRAMIDSWNVNEETILTLLSGQYSAVPLATSFKRASDPVKFARYDVSQSFLEEGGGRFRNNVVYLRRFNNDEKVMLAKLGNCGNGGYLIKDSTNGRMIGWRSLMLDMVDLFADVYCHIDKQLIIIESSNPIKFFRPALNVDKWFEDHTYSYEVYGTTEKRCRELLRTALQDYFRIEPRFERRKIRCLVIRRTSVNDKVKTHFPSEPPKREASGSLLSFRNAAYQEFVSKLQYYNRYVQNYKALPIFDETGFHADHRIDLRLNNIKDITGLNNQLKYYDIILEEAEREKDVLVLKELSDEEVNELSFFHQ
jgi:thiol-disulfide isomerase/thioredoxin